MTDILIPAYEPSGGLAELTKRLLADGFGVVIVDDGSTSPVPAIPGAEVLRHERNRGKGTALKTGFAWILEHHPETSVVVTADADGQHSPEDITRVAAATAKDCHRAVIGVRCFNGPMIPFRSWLGNLWTCGEFRLLTGHRLSDTQCGLRGFPRPLLKELLALPGERYEYEITILVKLAHRGLVQELPIQTIYLDGNSTSHFHPLRDTFRTQSALFQAAFRA